jgi:hypothetical protein
MTPNLPAIAAENAERKRVRAIRHLLRPQRTSWWGNTYRFKPVRLNKVFGDGKQIVQLFPINERPRYWIVQVDSAHRDDSDAFFEILDDIYEAIDEQFGCPPEDDDGIGDERPYFPAYDGQGTSWHFVR